MKQIFVILWFACLSTVVYAQKPNYAGQYQARFINILEGATFIEAKFEVLENGTITGNVKIGNETKALQGNVDPKGKFEAGSQTVDGLTISIKGRFSEKAGEEKISLVQRRVERSSGSKSVSENSLSGFMKRLSPAASPADTPSSAPIAAANVPDNGKTLLWFQHSKMLFGKEWADFPATVTVNTAGGQTVIEASMKMAALTEERRFRFRVAVQQPGQKIWTAKDIFVSSYTESKKKANGQEDRNFFFGTSGKILSGQIEIIGETEREMIFKITNLQLKRSVETDFVQIDGYLHAVKNS